MYIYVYIYIYIYIERERERERKTERDREITIFIGQYLIDMNTPVNIYKLRYLLIFLYSYSMDFFITTNIISVYGIINVALL